VHGTHKKSIERRKSTMVMTKEQKNKEEKYYASTLASVQKGIGGRRKIKKEELFLMRQFHKLGFEAGIDSEKKV